ncbi:Baseplate J-like protein [compost metagenome]
MQAPEAVSYNVNLTYHISSSRATEAATIQAAVNKAVSDYVMWQKSRLGRDINPSELIARTMAAGALRVNVTEPAFTVLHRTEVAKEEDISIIFGGLADD